MISKDEKILIVGLGLIGGSYAMGLTEKGYSVYALTKNQESIDYAKEHNMIKDGTIEIKKEFIQQFKIIIFSLYPKTFIDWIQQNHHLIKENTIITDVTGVKSSVVYKIQDIIKDDNIEYIGAHPMAGKEVYGVKNADNRIFKEANYIITPTDINTKKAILICQEIGELLEFKNISIIGPELHDEMIAFLSQLTHCIAVSLMTCKESKHLCEYTGDSFRDLTRIASINEEMWSELFLMNRKELVSQMDLFEKEFSKLKEAIKNDDIDIIKGMMKTSTMRRSYFNKR